jgi:hypothetical protein
MSRNSILVTSSSLHCRLPYCKFCKDVLMMVKWPKHVVIELKENNILWCWLKPETNLLSFCLITQRDVLYKSMVLLKPDFVWTKCSCWKARSVHFKVELALSAGLSGTVWIIGACLIAVFSVSWRNLKPESRFPFHERAKNLFFGKCGVQWNTEGLIVT